MELLENNMEGIDDLFIASQYTPLSVYQQIPVQWRANPETWETTISGDDFISPFHLYLPIQGNGEGARILLYLVLFGTLLKCY